MSWSICAILWGKILRILLWPIIFFNSVSHIFVGQILTEALIYCTIIFSVLCLVSLLLLLLPLNGLTSDSPVSKSGSYLCSNWHPDIVLHSLSYLWAGCEWAFQKIKHLPKEDPDWIYTHHRRHFGYFLFLNNVSAVLSMHVSWSCLTDAAVLVTGAAPDRGIRRAVSYFAC